MAAVAGSRPCSLTLGCTLRLAFATADPCRWLWWGKTQALYAWRLHRQWLELTAR